MHLRLETHLEQKVRTGPAGGQEKLWRHASPWLISRTYNSHQSPWRPAGEPFEEFKSICGRWVEEEEEEEEETSFKVRDGTQMPLDKINGSDSSFSASATLTCNCLSLLRNSNRVSVSPYFYRSLGWLRPIDAVYPSSCPCLYLAVPARFRLRPGGYCRCR
jgi:hypothetical protein